MGALLLAVLGSIVAGTILAATENPTEGSNCPPRRLAQFYSRFTEFVPQPIGDVDRHAGRRAELDACGDVARGTAFAADAVLALSLAPLALLAFRHRRVRRRTRHNASLADGP